MNPVPARTGREESGGEASRVSGLSVSLCACVCVCVILLNPFFHLAGFVGLGFRVWAVWAETWILAIYRPALRRTMPVGRDVGRHR